MVYKNFSQKKPFFIAEISANHNGSLANAKKLIFSAKKYGADAVKIQTYTPETMTIKSNKNDFKIKEGLWKGRNLWELYQDAQTPFEWQKKLFDYAKKIKITCFSTPFDSTAVDLLESLNCPFYKVASFEMNDIPLIKKIAQTKKPMIISTGMATLKEIDLAFYTAKKNGCSNIALLYCVSNYPSKLSDFNFNNIKILKERYRCSIGFSDHSTDNRIVAAAIASGAEIVEKHIALARQTRGPDIAFSTKGKDIEIYVKVIRNTSALMGKDFFFRNKSEKKSLKFRRSIYAVKNIKIGEKFSKKNVRVIRPGYGAEPFYFEKLIGNVSPKNIKSETPIKKSLLKKLKLTDY
ncbi:pseudaminic acid synthase [Candidatus Pelagibacter sp.]|nr:pseudaminic acid synthase [Candidatus Pelagibacter sp.]